MGICVLSPAHESEMRGYLVYVLIVKKIISSILFKFSHSILDWTVLSWNLGGFFETFLQGSVDHIIYRDYIVNRRFFIYCSLACGVVWMWCHSNVRWLLWDSPMPGRRCRIIVAALPIAAVCLRVLTGLAGISGAAKYVVYVLPGQC